MCEELQGVFIFIIYIVINNLYDLRNFLKSSLQIRDQLQNKILIQDCLQDFVELPPDDMQKLLVSNTVSIINIRIARWFHPKTNLKTQVAKGLKLFAKISLL